MLLDIDIDEAELWFSGYAYTSRYQDMVSKGAVMTRELDPGEERALVSEYRKVLAELMEFVVAEARGPGPAIASVFRTRVGEPPPLADIVVALRLDYTRLAQTLWSFTFKEFHSAWWDYSRETSTKSMREPARKRLDVACTNLRLRAARLKRLEYYGSVLTGLRQKAQQAWIESAFELDRAQESSPGTVSTQSCRELLAMVAPATLAEPLEAPPPLVNMFELVAGDLLLLAGREGAPTLTAVAFETLACCADFVPAVERFFEPYYRCPPQEVEAFLLICRGDLRSLSLPSRAFAAKDCLGFPLLSSEAASYTRWVNCARQNSLRPRRGARTACWCDCGEIPKGTTMRKRLYDFLHAALARNVL